MFLAHGIFKRRISRSIGCCMLSIRACSIYERLRSCIFSSQIFLTLAFPIQELVFADVELTRFLKRAFSIRECSWSWACQCFIWGLTECRGVPSHFQPKTTHFFAREMFFFALAIYSSLWCFFNHYVAFYVLPPFVTPFKYSIQIFTVISSAFHTELFDSLL